MKASDRQWQIEAFPTHSGPRFAGYLRRARGERDYVFGPKRGWSFAGGPRGDGSDTGAGCVGGSLRLC